MELKIRNVEPYAVKKIDELARKQNMSRNGYLKKQIETIAALGEIRRIDDRYKWLVQSVTAVIQENTTAFEQVVQLLERGNNNG